MNSILLLSLYKLRLDPLVDKLWQSRQVSRRYWGDHSLWPGSGLCDDVANHAPSKSPAMPVTAEWPCTTSLTYPHSAVVINWKYKF